MANAETKPAAPAESKPVEKQTNCLACNKPLRKLKIYYRNGKFYCNKTGNPGMATAGSGDVLTGMIAAFLGQGLSAFDAARYGVYLHGVAGDLAAKENSQISLIASDIVAKIPEAIKGCS